MNGKTLTPQKVTYILLGSLFLVLSGIGFIYFQQSNQLSEDIVMLQDEAVNQAVAEERIDQLKSLKHRLAEIEDISDDIDQILPSTKEQAEIIGQLATIAQEAGFGIDTISFESTGGLPTELSQTIEAKNPGLRIAPVRFSITKKRYSQLLNFLQDLENLQRFTQVDSLGITTATVEQGGSTENVLNFNMTLHIYMQAPDSQTQEKAGQPTAGQGESNG